MYFKPEFQAVVLAAGKGSRMLELTSGKPKCLLPIGPKPLIWYTLTKLQKCGFTEVILIVLEQQISLIQYTLNKEIENKSLHIKIDYITIPEEKDDIGTADSLRLKEVQDKIKTDVLVMSCDLITNDNFQGIVNSFRQFNSAISVLLFQSQCTDTEKKFPVPGPKSKQKPERDIIGIDVPTNRLLYLASASDFETEVPVSKNLIKKYSHIKFYSNLLDSHVYILKRWILDYLRNDDSFMSLKGELLPYIVKKQMSSPKLLTTQSNAMDPDQGTVEHQFDPTNIFSYVKCNELEKEIQELSSCDQGKQGQDLIRCFAYVAPSRVFGVRVNTIPAYWNLATNILDLWPKIVNDKELCRLSNHAEIQSTQVDNNSIVSDDAILREKTSFKSSFIGKKSVLNSYSRIINSIVMDNVVVKEKVAIENSIICDNVVIENGSTIKNCIIENCHLIQENSQFTNEILSNSLMLF